MKLVYPMVVMAKMNVDIVRKLAVKEGSGSTLALPYIPAIRNMFTENFIYVDNPFPILLFKHPNLDGKEEDVG